MNDNGWDVVEDGGVVGLGVGSDARPVVKFGWFEIADEILKDFMLFDGHALLGACKSDFHTDKDNPIGIKVKS